MYTEKGSFQNKPEIVDTPERAISFFGLRSLKSIKYARYKVKLYNQILPFLNPIKHRSLPVT